MLVGMFVVNGAKRSPINTTTIALCARYVPRATSLASRRSLSRIGANAKPSAIVADCILATVARHHGCWREYVLELGRKK